MPQWSNRLPNMRRVASLLALLALLLGQVGARLHDLTHMKHDLAVVRHGENNVPPIQHSPEVCVAYSHFGNTVSHATTWHFPIAGPAVALPILFTFFLPLALRLDFYVRAPPPISRL